VILSALYDIEAPDPGLYTLLLDEIRLNEHAAIDEQQCCAGTPGVARWAADYLAHEYVGEGPNTRALTLIWQWARCSDQRPCCLRMLMVCRGGRRWRGEPTARTCYGARATTAAIGRAIGHRGPELLVQQGLAPGAPGRPKTAVRLSMWPGLSRYGFGALSSSRVWTKEAQDVPASRFLVVSPLAAP
jgi:hypothetical protein